MNPLVNYGFLLCQ
jgi:pimeloyl-ACP methyl ester carboxylesterase